MIAITSMNLAFGWTGSKSRDLRKLPIASSNESIKMKPHAFLFKQLMSSYKSPVLWLCFYSLRSQILKNFVLSINVPNPLTPVAMPWTKLILAGTFSSWRPSVPSFKASMASWWRLSLVSVNAIQALTSSKCYSKPHGFKAFPPPFIARFSYSRFAAGLISSSLFLRSCFYASLKSFNANSANYFFSHFLCFFFDIRET